MRIVRNINVLAVTALSLVLTSLPVWAEEAGAGEKGGLPMLDTSLFPEQLFWLAVSFVVLYILMSSVALPRVAKTQTNRRLMIELELDAARQANEAAKVAVAAVEKSLTAARSNGQAKISEMVAQVTEESAARQTAQERDLLRHLHRAEADISVTREAALSAIRASAEELAATVIEKVTGTKTRVQA
jgi:F-type H+-transporting ATPase subunit b